MEFVESDTLRWRGGAVGPPQKSGGAGAEKEQHRQTRGCSHIVVCPWTGAFSRIDNPDILARKSRHPEGKIFGIALISVEEDDEGKVVTCTLKEQSIQVARVIVDVGPENLQYNP